MFCLMGATLILFLLKPTLIELIIFRSVSEATVSTLIFILLIAMPSHVSFLNYFGSESNYLPQRRSRGAISWHFVRAKVPWKAIFLMGGGLVLAEGSRVTQMSYHIANYIITLDHFPKLFLSFVFCCPVFLLTQVIGNSPLAYMSLPIIVDLAECHQIHPTYFMIPVALMCSLALTTPSGAGANALVVGFANIRAVDVAQVGLVPAVVSFFLVWLSFPLYGSLLFPEIREKDFTGNGSSCSEHVINH